MVLGNTCPADFEHILLDNFGENTQIKDSGTVKPQPRFRHCIVLNSVGGNHPVIGLVKNN